MSAFRETGRLDRARQRALRAHHPRRGAPERGRGPCCGSAGASSRSSRPSARASRTCSSASSRTWTPRWRRGAVHEGLHRERRGGLPRGGGALDADRLLHAVDALHPDLRDGREPRHRRRRARGGEALRSDGGDGQPRRGRGQARAGLRVGILGIPRPPRGRSSRSSRRRTWCRGSRRRVRSTSTSRAPSAACRCSSRATSRGCILRGRESRVPDRLACGLIIVWKTHVANGRFFLAGVSIFLLHVRGAARLRVPRRSRDLFDGRLAHGDVRGLLLLRDDLAAQLEDLGRRCPPSNGPRISSEALYWIFPKTAELGEATVAPRRRETPCARSLT